MPRQPRTPLSQKLAATLPATALLLLFAFACHSAKKEAALEMVPPPPPPPPPG